jgi:hypothetical protein
VDHAEVLSPDNKVWYLMDAPADSHFERGDRLLTTLSEHAGVSWDERLALLDE